MSHTHLTYALTVPNMICQAFFYRVPCKRKTGQQNMNRGGNEKEKRGGHRWVGGRENQTITENVMADGLSMLAEHHPSVSLSACLVFRLSLCSSLEYVLPPRECQALNRHTNEATFLLCITVFTRNCGRRKTKMKLITLALSLPLPLIYSLFFFHPQVQSSCRLFN